MAQTSKIGPRSMKVTTYAKLESWVKAFVDGHINLLILIGDAGLGKSRSVRSVLNGNTCWIEGYATALGMYCVLYEHRDKFVVIDDVDGIYGDKSGVRLLKCLCQSEDEKTVSWNTSAPILEKQSIPKTFTTKSRVVIISNDWRTLNRNVAAIEDRGHVIFFEPNAKEVHVRAADFFKDEEIYDWFGANLKRIKQPSFRLYIKAREMKKSGLDWTTILGESSSDFRAELFAELVKSQEYATQEERVRAFTARGGGSRATYFNYRKKYEEKV